MFIVSPSYSKYKKGDVFRVGSVSIITVAEEAFCQSALYSFNKVSAIAYTCSRTSAITI